MPATAGRVRMPANNRVHSSAALQTHGIWQSAIGYDPYAPAADKSKGSKPDMDPGNAYASFRDLLTLARFTNTNTNETRGTCKKCGRVGHLTFQCRNFLILKDDRPVAAAENDDSTLRTAKVIFEKIKKKDEIESEDDDDEDDEISSSDSDVDPEMERIIAERFVRPLSKKAETLIKKRKKRSNWSESDDEEERRTKRKHRLRHHRKSDDDLDSDRHHTHKRRRRRMRRAKETDYDSNSSRESDRQRSRRWRQHTDRRSILSSGSESTGSSSDDDERRERRRKKRSRGHRREGD